jgi:hypothetical protein
MGSTDTYALRQFFNSELLVRQVGRDFSFQLFNKRIFT